MFSATQTKGFKYPQTHIPSEASNMDAEENRIRVLEQQVETLREMLTSVLGTVEALQDRLLARMSNEEQEYVPASVKGYDPAVG